MIAGLAFCAAASAFDVLDLYLQLILIYVGINIILAASLSLCSGFTGIFSMGHAGFMAIGAYASALATIPVAKKAILLKNLPDWLQQV